MSDYYSLVGTSGDFADVILVKLWHLMHISFAVIAACFKSVSNEVLYDLRIESAGSTVHAVVATPGFERK